MANPEFYPLPTWSPFYERPKHIFKNSSLITIIGKARPGTLSDLVAWPLKPEIAEGEYFFLWLSHFDRILMENATERNALLFDIGMPVSYGEMRGRHCFLEYLNSGFGVSAGRELWGWPKKHAELSWVEHDGRFHIEVKKDGYTLAIINFEEREPLNASAWPHIPGFGDSDPYLQVRPHGQVDASGALPLDVIATDPDDAAVFHSVNGGDANIQFFDGPTDPLSFLGPVEIVAARIDRYDFEFGWPRVVATENLQNPRQYSQERMALAKKLRAQAGFGHSDNPTRL